jgi:hypothetical protein
VTVLMSVIPEAVFPRDGLVHQQPRVTVVLVDDLQHVLAPDNRYQCLGVSLLVDEERFVILRAEEAVDRNQVFGLNTWAIL